MPDLDRLPRGLRRSWRSVADAVRGQQPPPVVGDAIEKALAETLRHSGGLQWLPELAEAVAACRDDYSLRPLELVADALDRGTATGVGGAFVDAAWSLAAEVDGNPGDHSIVDELVVRGLERMIYKLCLGPLEPDMVPGVFSSVRDLRLFVETCMAEVRLEDLGRQLTRTGCSGHVRAPRTRLPRPGTKELLHEPIG